MTFAIAGVCAKSDQIGYAVTTSSVCVGARVGLVSEGCVVFSQARTDPRLHQVGAAAFHRTQNADKAVEAMKSAATGLHWRQLGVLARNGETAHFTGESCLPHCGGLAAKGCLALGNFLGSNQVLAAMIDVIITAGAHDARPLAACLIDALKAGAAAGGEQDPLQSSALQVLGPDGLMDADLRVDKSTDPLNDLALLWRDWQPKASAYRLRALAPDEAPSSSTLEHGSPQR